MTPKAVIYARLPPNVISPTPACLLTLTAAVDVL